MNFFRNLSCILQSKTFPYGCKYIARPASEEVVFFLNLNFLPIDYVSSS